jgi:hydrogenase maturation protease
MAPGKPDHRSQMTGRLTVIGVGNPDCGDDAVGLHVARAITDRLPPGVDIIESHGNLSELSSALDAANRVILIDAMQSGAAPGTVCQFDAAASPLPSVYFRLSSHAFGMVEAIELSRTLGRLPGEVIVIGIEGRDFSTGAALSDNVGKAIEEAAEITVDRATTWCTGDEE